MKDKAYSSTINSHPRGGWGVRTAGGVDRCLYPPQSFQLKLTAYQNVMQGNFVFSYISFSSVWLSDVGKQNFVRKLQGKLEIGIRPMYLEVHEASLEGGIPAAVKSVEDQGSFKILTLNMNGHVLRARLPEGQAVPSNEAWLRFPPQWTKLFAGGRLVSK